MSTYKGLDTQGKQVKILTDHLVLSAVNDINMSVSLHREDIEFHPTPFHL
ncbi:hypothetical protein [Paenibacillus sp. OV219]|nr:hypothetical protein [Paenibacillus sp. OV219]